MNNSSITRTRLVVSRKRAVLRAHRRIEPALAVRLHDERVVAAYRIYAIN